MFDMSSLLITTAKGGSNEHQSRWMRLKKREVYPQGHTASMPGPGFIPGPTPKSARSAGHPAMLRPPPPGL